MELTTKQLWGLNLLTDGTTKSVGYGGAAGGGKSYLGCYWLMLMCTELKGSKWFIGRDSLKDTRESVLFTFRKVSKELNFKDVWRYADNHIHFTNGSEIEFLDVSFYPQKDPLYERFGSKEYTGGWLEESGAIHYLAYEILQTRVGRWFNEEFNIIGKILNTFNPKKNWLDAEFYRPWKLNQETVTTKFIRALATDNPHLPAEYIERLRNIKDKATRERLWHGNFDYDDDPTSMISYESIMNIWNNTHIKSKGDRYTISDIARYGSDKAIITVWDGLVLIDYHIFPIASTVTQQNCINAMRSKYQIQATRCLADEGGVGGGVVDNCKIAGFDNASSPIDKAYYRIKDECGYKLAETINSIWFQAEVDTVTKTAIEEELAQLKTFDADKDGKLRILPKKQIKENIGRSPDWLDIFIMRMYYLLFNSEAVDTAYQKALQLFN